MCLEAADNDDDDADDADDADADDDDDDAEEREKPKMAATLLEREDRLLLSEVEVEVVVEGV